MQRGRPRKDRAPDPTDSLFWDRQGGWIYAAREEGALRVKIGCTRQPVSDRLRSLGYEHRTAFICVGAVFVRRYKLYTVESSVHQVLARHWLEGEWFLLAMNQPALEKVVQQAVQRIR
jgi:hypothetical protein